jgi:hypothetical protein
MTTGYSRLILGRPAGLTPVPDFISVRAFQEAKPMPSCNTCGDPCRNKFCSHPCYAQSKIGIRHSPETKAKMRDARIANNPMKGRKHTEDTRAKMRAADNPAWATGEDAINWKGGRVIDTNGYVQIYMPAHPNAVGNYVPEHRLVMETHLGRVLDSSEEVHHDNEDKQDNRIENLKLLTKSEHIRLHLAREKSLGINRFKR